MSIALNELTVQNSITTGEKFIVAGSSSEVQVDYATLARAIIEQWTGSSLGGSNRSLKAILDEISGNYVPFKLYSPTMIAQNTDLNTLTTAGSYYCNGNNIAATLVNCPVNVTFRMNVYTIWSRDSGSYAYIFQEIIPYNSTVIYRRRCATGATADAWTYGDWTLLSDPTAYRGTAINEGDDLNDYRTPGKYLSGDSTRTGTLLHCPVTGNGFTMTVEVSSATYFKQIIIANDMSIYIRRLSSGGVWGSWYKVTTTEVTS